MRRTIIQKREVMAQACPSAQQSAGDGKAASGLSWADKAVSVSRPGQALSVAAYYRGVELRARTMSQLVIEYQKRSPLGGNYTVDNYGANGLLNYLLQVEPNPLMASTEMLKQMEIAKILDGNAYVYIERGLSGDVANFWLCDTGTWNPNDNTYAISYKTIGGVASKLGVPASDIIHLPNTFTFDGKTGVPTHVYARNVLAISATNDKLVLDNAAKGGRMKLLIQEEKQQGFGLGRANEKELRKITSQLNDELYNQDAVFLNNVASVTPISQSLSDQDVSVIRQFNVREVARMLGVPPILLMDDSNSSYKSPEAATQEFLLRTIQPNILELEDELNRKLLSAFDFGKRRIHVCERNLLRLDPKASAEVDKMRLETGTKTVNELRSENDMPRVDNGDDVYVSTNLAVAGSDKLKGWTSPKEGGAA